MARPLRKSFARLEAILERQAGPTRWLAEYMPSNVTVDPDTPKQTRPSAFVDPYLGRPVSTQAGTEGWFFLLARHNPKLLDFHEQKMLAYNASPHPLSNHPTALGLQLPSLRGTLEIAYSMGKLKDHSMVRAPLSHPKYPGKLVPFPYIGDSLLYLVDSKGPYPVNWSIKKTLADFHRSYRRRRGPPSEADRESAEFRHELERLYYLDGQIPTHQLVPSMVDKNLLVNLLDLYYWIARPTSDNHPWELQEEIVAWYREQLPLGRLMNDHAKAASAKFQITHYDARLILKSAIFKRELRVELFTVVADDQLLQPEVNDPFVRYADWFRRMA